MRAARALPGLLTLASLGAGAHPHGALDCGLNVQVHEGRVTALALTLVLDAASSAQLQERVRVSAEEPAREARAFRALLAGLFRQSGWMLQARAAAASGAAAWSDPDPPVWSWRPEGRLQIQVNLQPASGPLPADGLALRCQDSSWYWLALYQAPADVRVGGTACSVELDDWQRASDRARSQQAMAQQAGVSGADAMAPGLADDTRRGAALARLRC